jgi:hypothetical protein
VELPRAGTVCWNTVVRDSGTPNFLASRREGKGRLGSFPSGTGRNARTSIHLILPILRDHCLTSLLIPLTTPPQPHPIADDETPSPPLCARISPAPPTRYAPSAAVPPKLPFLPLRLRLLLQQIQLCFYRYPLTTTTFTALYSTVSASCTALVPSCLLNPSGCPPAATSLYSTRCSPAQPSIATRRRPHPRLTTVLERIPARQPAIRQPDRPQHTCSLCTARPAIPAASSCASPDSAAAPSPQSAVALARTR